MTVRSDDLRLEIERTFPAPPAAVFSAFSDHKELVKWWGPEGFSVPGLQFDPRVGESYRIEMQPPDGESFFLAGKFREVDAPARLAYTFLWEPPDPDDIETLVTLSFRDLGDATVVTLTQGRFKTEARVALHHHGWSESFEKLERLMS